MKTIIYAENLVKVFYQQKESFKVLKGINLNIEAGSFVSIMGPSGCGKSTLLYLLGGLDFPTEGKVKVKGVDLSEINSKALCQLRRKEIGFVFQFYNLVPNLTVEDNILLPVLLSNKKPRDYKEKLNEILEMIGMDDKAKNIPRELSGGQQQRVAIARSLLHEPEVILADEPIGNLDSKSGTQVMKLFEKINSRYGTTIVQVTHSEEAACYGKITIRMKDGEIIS